MPKIYDLIILGAGPSGITASVYSARKKIDFLVITQDIGGQAAWSGDIENYIGYQFISGPQLVMKFEEHMRHFGIDIRMPEEVKDIFKDNELVHTVTDKSEYLSRTLIVATGKRPKELGVEGEREFKNRGVTYCATCDGPLFSGKIVAIIGGGNSALDADLQMVKISPLVYIINIGERLTADRVMVEKINSYPNVVIYNRTIVKRIYGDKCVK
ncbi:MAG: NAD(P)-binding domain-containing protein [Candidatus Omnitrophica bacterium]|nr:NAD(P)-binding domain-containing protein [Candidatus Omnitrophota bacterium]